MLIQKSELKEIWKSLGKRKLDELKQEIIAILKKQEEKDYKKAIEQFSKEEKKYKYLEKSISGEWIKKAGYGIGTVRVWKGKKYKKIAPGKWARMYEKEGRGTNIAVGHLIAKVKKIDDIEELMNFVMQNKQRFQDENGMDLPILDKIRAEVDEQNKKISSGKVGSKGKTESAISDLMTINWSETDGKDVYKVIDGYFKTDAEKKKFLKDIGSDTRINKFQKELISDVIEENNKPAEKQEENTEKKDETKVAIKGKFATDKQIDYVTEVSDKTILSTEKMLKKPITTIQRYANSHVEDFKGSVDKFIEYMTDRQSEISLDEIAKEWARLVNHNVARKIWEKYQDGALEINDDGYFQEKKEEKQQNRSEAMKGNKNAYKGGPKEVAKYINGKTTKDSERKELLNEALNARYGTDKKDPFYSIGDLYSKVKQLTPHSDKWYDAINNYDEASELYRMVIGDNKLDYYNDEIEKERMKPNYKKEELPKKEEKQQNQMTPKQQKTFDDFEKKAIKKASNADQGKRFAKHNYNIDGEDWTITTDGRVMLCSREKFEEPTKTDKITNMDKVFVINGQEESVIPDGIDAIIKAAPKTVVTGKDYNGKEIKEFSIIKLGDRYFNTDYLKTVQNFLGPLSNVKMQVIPGDNKSRVKFESSNKAVVLLPIENNDELENRIINKNDIKKSLEDIIMFCNDFEDEDEVIEEINNESLFSDYSAENPTEFNSIAFKVEEVLNECGICGL